MQTTRIIALSLLCASAAGAQGTDAKRCPSDGDDIRIAALAGIVQLDPSQVVPVLKQQLERRDECSVALRRQAVGMLARSREPERMDILIHVARTDPNIDVRRQALQYLSQSNTERTAAALDSMLFNSTDTALQDGVLRALAQQSSGSARASIRRAAESSTFSTDMRMRAVNYLGWNRQHEDETAFLKQLYPKSQAPEMREAVMRAIASQGTADATTWLMGIARDKNQEIDVRRRALSSVAQYSSSQDAQRSGHPGLELKDLIALYDEFAGQREMQDQLLDVYARRPESAATDKLLAIAQGDANVEQRKKAISRLGQRKDPRVRQFLLDIVNK